MDVIVVGLGSMGKRRIRLLKKCKDIEIIIGVDSREDRRKECEEKYSLSTSDKIDNALSQIKKDKACVFVCTSPLAHAEIISLCLENDLNVFTELNLISEGYEKNIKLAENKDLVLFMSSTNFYRKEVLYLMKRISESDVSKLTYTFHVGQYLPDWHPWENLHDFFLSEKRTNGCREIMAIEFPWLLHVFGEVESFSVIAGEKTKKGLGYNDCVSIVMKHLSGAQGTCTFDVVSRKPVHQFRVFGEDLFLTWDGTPEGLYDFDIENQKDRNISLYTSIDRQEGYQAAITEEEYLTEVQAFLKQVTDGITPPYTFEDDLRTIELIDRIEAAE